MSAEAILPDATSQGHGATYHEVRRARQFPSESERVLISKDDFEVKVVVELEMHGQQERGEGFTLVDDELPGFLLPFVLALETRDPPHWVVLRKLPQIRPEERSRLDVLGGVEEELRVLEGHVVRVEIDHFLETRQEDRKGLDVVVAGGAVVMAYVKIAQAITLTFELGLDVHRRDTSNAYDVRNLLPTQLVIQVPYLHGQLAAMEFTQQTNARISVRPRCTTGCVYNPSPAIPHVAVRAILARLSKERLPFVFSR